jgi:hypothetical protein
MRAHRSPLGRRGVRTSPDAAAILTPESADGLGAAKVSTSGAGAITALSPNAARAETDPAPTLTIGSRISANAGKQAKIDKTLTVADRIFLPFFRMIEQIANRVQGKNDFGFMISDF